MVPQIVGGITRPAGYKTLVTGVFYAAPYFQPNGTVPTYGATPNFAANTIYGTDIVIEETIPLASISIWVQAIATADKGFEAAIYRALADGTYEQFYTTGFQTVAAAFADPGIVQVDTTGATIPPGKYAIVFCTDTAYNSTGWNVGSHTGGGVFGRTTMDVATTADNRYWTKAHTLASLTPLPATISSVTYAGSIALPTVGLSV